MKRISTLFLALSVTLVLVSCDKKDDPPAPPAPTKTDHITKSTWVFQSATAAGLGDISNYPQLACYIDNSITFASNLSGTISEGALSCTSPAPPTFTWNFQSSETILHLSFTLFAGGSPDFEIVSLDGTNLVVRQTVTLTGVPMPVTITVTFRH